MAGWSFGRFLVRANIRRIRKVGRETKKALFGPKFSIPREIRSVPIIVLDIPPRTKRALTKGEFTDYQGRTHITPITKLGDLDGIRPADLLRIKGLGEVGLGHLRNQIKLLPGRRNEVDR